jgi:hypothetical protein
MSHLETLIAEYLEWQGYLIKRNIKIGRRPNGGWEMEIDVIGFHPQQARIVHYEPSIDAMTWGVREERYEKKFTTARKYMFRELFPWLPTSTSVEQFAVFYNHPKGRDYIAGAKIVSIDELMSEIRATVIQRGPMIKNAISEQYPLLRTLQMSHCGYQKVIVQMPQTAFASSE